MRMEDAQRHEIKVDACEWRAHTDTKGKLVVWTPAKLGWGKGARVKRSERAGFEKLNSSSMKPDPLLVRLILLVRCAIIEWFVTSARVTVGLAR
jgi:hypothetical protein